MGIIDTGVSIHHQDLAANTQKSCEDFVNGDHSCDEGSIRGSSKVTHPAMALGQSHTTELDVPFTVSRKHRHRPGSESWRRCFLVVVSCLLINRSGGNTGAAILRFKRDWGCFRVDAERTEGSAPIPAATQLCPPTRHRPTLCCCCRATAHTPPASSPGPATTASALRASTGSPASSAAPCSLTTAPLGTAPAPPLPPSSASTGCEPLPPGPQCPAISAHCRIRHVTGIA